MDSLKELLDAAEKEARIRRLTFVEPYLLHRARAELAALEEAAGNLLRVVPYGVTEDVDRAIKGLAALLTKEGER